MGMLSFASNWMFALVILGLGLVWFFYSLLFFKRAADYYKAELDDRTNKREHMTELLAKLDQLVDVLKVK